MSRSYVERLGFEVELRTEGKARFLTPVIPREKSYAPTSLPVFFNPVSKPSRDMAVLFLKTWFKDRGISVCEPLAGTGVRSIRLVLETGVVEKAVANDISAHAYKLIQVNAEMNGVQDSVDALNLDANELLAVRGRGRPRFDYVDIDPAGSPAKFMENGFRGCGRGGVLGATATDLSALTGAKPSSCLRKYGVLSAKTPFLKEVALRILAGFMVKTAARIGLAAKPILSFQRDHYLRVFVEVWPGIERVKALLREMGWLSFCPACLSILTSAIHHPPNPLCQRCGARTQVIGPLWLGVLTIESLASEMLEEAHRDPETYGDVVRMLERMSGEDSSIVGYMPVNYLASRFKASPVKPVRLVEKLRERGYRATLTHLDPGGVKTDAPPDELRRIFVGEG